MQQTTFLQHSSVSCRSLHLVNNWEDMENFTGVTDMPVENFIGLDKCFAEHTAFFCNFVLSLYKYWGRTTKGKVKL